MANVNMNVTYKQYPKTNYRSGYRGLTAVSNFGNGREFTYSNVSGKAVVNFIDEALSDFVQRSVENEDEAHDVTVNLPDEIVLTEALQTHLSDKYGADPAVNTLTFA